MRYDLAPLERMVGSQFTLVGGQCAPVMALAVALGVNRQTIHRARKNGLSVAQADRLAVAAGFHPANVWTSWVDDLEDDLRDAERRAQWWERLDRYRETVAVPPLTLVAA